MATTTGHPGRTLIVLAVLVAGLITLMAVSGTWIPKLGLDLRGGTTITLTAKNTTGTGTVDPNSLQLAKTIIQSRVDSLGVGESEVTTAGDNQIIVTVPNVQQDELVRLVGQTAVLRFRAVYAAEQVQPPEPTPAATSEPSQAATAPPSGEPTAGRLRDGAGAGRRAERTGQHRAKRHWQQQAAARAADRTAAPAGQGLRTGRRQGNSARQGAGLAADRSLSGCIRRIHLRNQSDRGRRPGPVRVQPGEDREVPARTDADRGEPAGQRRSPAFRRTMSTGW